MSALLFVACGSALVPLQAATERGVDHPLSSPSLSPRIAQLKRALSVGNRESLKQFWIDVQDHGTPLVEAVPSDPDHSLVTFLWRAQRPLRNVLLVSGLSNNSYSGDVLRENTLLRIPGTDVWYRTYRVRNDARFTYSFSVDDSLVPSEDERSPDVRESKFRPDPLNTRHVSGPNSDSLIELPDAPLQAWFQARSDVPKGGLTTARLHSKILNNDRQLTIYTPPGYETSGGPYHLLILMDGEAYTTDIPTPTILDNLQAARQTPPFVGIFIGNVTDDQPAARTIELSCSSRFGDFLANELLPWVHEHYQVTSLPSETILGGVSRGGTAAVCAALDHSGAFGNVLTQSGFFVFKDRNWFKNTSPNATPDLEAQIEMGWEQYGIVMQRIANLPKLPLRFSLDVGKFENDFHPSPLIANRHLRDVLIAKGYAVKYQEFAGHHSAANWRGTFPDALLFLLNK